MAIVLGPCVETFRYLLLSFNFLFLLYINKFMTSGYTPRNVNVVYYFTINKTSEQ